VDLSKVGLPIQCVIELRLTNHGSQKVYDALAEIPELTECHRVTGDPCVIMQAAVGTMPQLEDLINRVAKFGFSKTSIILSSAIERRVPLGQLDTNGKNAGLSIVPTLRVGMHPVTLCVTTLRADAERPGQHSHAERGNDQLPERRGQLWELACLRWHQWPHRLRSYKELDLRWTIKSTICLMVVM
jgi:hypothetical protein